MRSSRRRATPFEAVCPTFRLSLAKTRSESDQLIPRSTAGDPHASVRAHIHHAVFAAVEAIGQQLEGLALERVRDGENSWEMRITRCNARLTPTRCASA